MQWRGVRRLSVRLSVCLSKLFEWPDRHQTFTRWTPGQRASRVCSRSRSKVTWYGHFCAGTKITSSRRQMAGSRPNLHRMVSRWTCIKDVLKVKVKVKGHVILALLFGFLKWATPSLTVWLFFNKTTLMCLCVNVWSGRGSGPADGGGCRVEHHHQQEVDSRTCSHCRVYLQLLEIYLRRPVLCFVMAFLETNLIVGEKCEISRRAAYKHAKFLTVFLCKFCGSYWDFLSK